MLQEVHSCSLVSECLKIESNHKKRKKERRRRKKNERKRKKILFNIDLGDILRKLDFYILVRLLQSWRALVSLGKSPILVFKMNEEDAGKGMDLGFAIKMCQGREQINAVLQLTRARFPTGNPSPASPATFVTAKPAGGQSVGNQSCDQNKPLRKESYVPRSSRTYHPRGWW